MKNKARVFFIYDSTGGCHLVQHVQARLYVTILAPQREYPTSFSLSFLYQPLPKSFCHFVLRMHLDKSRAKAFNIFFSRAFLLLKVLIFLFNRSMDDKKSPIHLSLIFIFFFVLFLLTQNSILIIFFYPKKKISVENQSKLKNHFFQSFLN